MNPFRWIERLLEPSSLPGGAQFRSGQSFASTLGPLRLATINVWRDLRDQEVPLALSFQVSPWDGRTDAAALAAIHGAYQRLGAHRVESEGMGSEVHVGFVGVTAEGRHVAICSATHEPIPVVEPFVLPVGDHYFRVTANVRGQGRSVARDYRLRLEVRADGASDPYVDSPDDRASLFTWWPRRWPGISIVVAALLVPFVAPLGVTEMGLMLDFVGALVLSLNAFKRVGRFRGGSALGGGGYPVSPQVQREKDRVTVQARLGAGLLASGFFLQFVGALPRQ